MREDWIECELGDLLKLKNGFAFQATNYKKEGIPVFRIGDINDWIVSAKNSVKIEEKEVYDEYIVEAGDILIAMSGATTGKFGIYHSTEKAYQNQRVGNLKLYSENSINKSFVFYLLYSLKRDIERDAYGGAQPNISGIKIEALKTKLAPLPIQRAIVSKIEALFSDLDNGIANFKKAQEQLKIYRQAVLKKAFEGGFTNENVIEGELPFGWVWKKISEISNVVRGGSPRPAGDPKFYDGNIPFLKVRDITKDNGKFLNTFEYTIKEAGLHKTRQIKPNTLLLSNSGATLGVPKICMIDATMNDGIAAFLNLDERSNLYLYYFWISKTKELRNINMGAAQPNLNTDIIKNYLVPYCSFEEQTQIVQEIESRLSVCDKMEQSITESLEKAEALRQSILKKAFEGKLLSQAEIELCKKETDYEPASELLKKIQAEKLAAAQEKKKPIVKKKSKK